MMIGNIDCPVPLLQDNWEFSELLKVYSIAAPKTILEIGTFYGGSLWHWLAFNQNLEMVFCIDLPITDADPRFEFLCECKALWKSWPGIEKAVYIAGNSHDDWLINRNFPTIDWLFIDGDHTYRGVKKDWLSYSPKVRPGGFIVLHDIHGIRGVRRLWRQIKDKHRTIEIIAPGGWGIGIIQKT
jgi:predicted O-methyltransferase YrrM